MRLTRRAEDELEVQALWYEVERPGLGVSFLSAVGDAFRRIRANPAAYPVYVEGIRRAGIRRFPYNIFFAIGADGLVVLSVLHVRRDPKIWPTGVSDSRRQFYVAALP